MNKKTMTPRQRMARAMRLEKPDRVPVMCQMSIGHMLLQTGFPPSEFWFSAERFAEGLVRLRDIYGFDGILVSLHGHFPDWEKNILRVVREERKETVHWKNGDRTVFPADDLPLHFARAERPVPLLSDFDPASLEGALSFIPVSQGLEFRLDPDHPYTVFDIVRAEAGPDISIHGEVTSPFDYFLHLFGFDQALIGLVEQPSRCREVLQVFSRAVMKIAAGQAGRGIDALKISSPFAGSGFISPRFYREFVLPYEALVAGAARSLGIPAYTHTCGAVNDRLEVMLEAGISGIECLDPPPLGDVELGEAKKRIGRKAFIKGNIDPVNTLLFKDLGAVRKDAIARIEAGKPGGGFILSTACSIAPHTRRENIQALAPLVESFGA